MNYYIQSISSISPYPTFETDDFLSVPVVNKEEKYLYAIEPDYKNYITDANMRRRMSRIVKMGVSAALNCVRNSDIENPDAIITGTGLGCLADTEKFLNSLIENNEQLLNPTAFIQSTFNTIGAQIALILKNHNYNFTYVHRGFSFESALLDAMMQLNEGTIKNALIGAVDEITPSSAHIMERMGFWRNGAKMGEGAQFFMLSSEKSNKDFAVLKDVSTFLSIEKENNLEKQVFSFLKKNNLNVEDIDILLSGNTENPTQDIFNTIPSATFKHICGEYQTASSFAAWCAANILKNQIIPNSLLPTSKPKKTEKILIFNSYQNTNHSLILLEKA